MQVHHHGTHDAISTEVMHYAYDSPPYAIAVVVTRVPISTKH
jgi:hypothetical protein